MDTKGHPEAAQVVDSYKELLLKDFLRALKNDTAPEGIEKDVWEEFKERFELDNSSIETQQNRDKQQKVFRFSFQIEMLLMLRNFVLMCPDKHADFFETAGMTPKENAVEGVKYINTQIEKNRAKLKMHEAELRQMPQKDDEEGEKSDIYEVLATIGAINGQRLEYSSLTVGEFMAQQKISEKIAKNGGR